MPEVIICLVREGFGYLEENNQKFLKRKMVDRKNRSVNQTCLSVL